MQRTPSEIVYAVVNTVGGVLHNTVEAALRRFYGQGWHTHLPRSVRVRDGVAHWDAAAVLHTLRHTWRDVFQARYGEDGKHFAGELIGARNRAAHHAPGEALPLEDAARAIDTARRLLRTLEVEDSAKLDALSAELTPASPRRASATPKREPSPGAADAHTYAAQRLTFRARVIEALSDDQSFRVLTPHGTFEMTKAAFYCEFPNVVASRSYIENGVYHYPTIPSKALPFLLRGVADDGSTPPDAARGAGSGSRGR